MAAYFRIFFNTLQEYAVYRVNFLLWRVRSIIVFLIRYSIWIAAYEHVQSVASYSKEYMLTYIFFSSVLNDIVLSSKTYDIAAEIVEGKIINQLVKPISYFGIHLSREFADKLINIVCSLIEISFLIFILKPSLFIQTNLVTILLVGIFLVMGVIIAFFVNVSLSFVGFWTPEVWAGRFIFFVLVTFFSGWFFPLDILPPILYQALLMTPFPYFYFIPLKIYLGIPFIEILFYAGLAVSWVILSWIIAKRLWKKGMYQFSFFGK
ncbi:hypothetical protein A3D06_01240 [Candidatus Roizmanbacteria bacterium RIFCSPHIGHO2_02_FULL_40_9]|uniref:ABC-2 type transporter domain-containing protein n=1 Tax=Candidatus Roizmanbacteria bacterium RIFCSPHIGHO2_02_FULL_40_9 TaxID=1802042 RepID=A0A1F7HDR4_9BACT|nr:MAG: hypothetical protein A3D06_01240 [Candidatus Roizmanbacteria bacterium RIFCSPHIGHO2_02_FULL_40_9]